MKRKVDERQLAMNCEPMHVEGGPPMSLPKQSESCHEHLRLESLVPPKGFVRDEVNELKEQCVNRAVWPIEVYTEKLRELLAKHGII